MDPKLANELRELAQKNAEILQANADKVAVLQDRLTALEQKGTLSTMDVRSGATPGLAEVLTKSDAFQQFAKGNSPVARIELPHGLLEAQKTAIVNATQNTSQPLVQGSRLAGLVVEPQRRLFLRELLPSFPTNSNLIEYTRENVYTNNAGPQYSSPDRENVTKPESGITFELKTAPVITYAHWLPVSKQVMDDSPALAAYIGPRLAYGLALKVDADLLNGAGTGGSLTGLLTAPNFTAYNRTTSGDTKIDALGRAMVQLALSDYMADTIVVNPEDWEDIMLAKTQDLEYVLSNPADGALGQSLFGCRVVVSNQIGSGTFLVANMAMGAAIHDRQQTTIEMSRNNGTDFVKNMVTVLAETRLALTVFRPKAFIKGTF